MTPWQEDYKALLARVKGPGLVDPARIAKMSGLELLQGIVDGTVPYPPINETLDFYLLEVEEGRAVFQGRPSMKHYNPISTVHGGFHATLLDSAMACAIHSLIAPGQAYTTLEFKVHLVRPLTEKTGPVRAEGKIVASGRRTATSEGRLVDEEGRLYSHGTTTCLIFDLEGARG
jgi:uncharacterized protein (TIGR00369 family)